MESNHISNNDSSVAAWNNATTTNTILKSSYDIDVVRLIGQYLVNMGLKQTANLLLEESGLHQLDHPVLIKFGDHVMAGEWDKANQLVEHVVNLAVSSNSLSNWIQPLAQTTDVTSKHQNGSNLTNLETCSSKTTGNAEQKRRSNIDAIRLTIAEQKFLELLEDNERIRALRCLRCEITPLCKNVDHAQFFTTLLMCKSIDEIHLKANWSGKNQQTRQILFDKIRRFIPPTILLPPKRLETLLNQAVQLQKERCVLHINRSQNHQASTTIRQITSSNNSKSIPLNQSATFIKPSSIATIISDQDHIGCNGVCSLFERQPQKNPVTNGCDHHVMSTSQSESDINNHDTADAQDDDHVIDLKSDHICTATNFPLLAKQALESHDGEVWFCKFSNDGTRLATGGVKGKIVIWTLDQETNMLIEKNTLGCSCYSFTCLSWSPDDAYLLACGSEERPTLWLWNMETERVKATIVIKNEMSDGTTTCSWHPSGRRFAVASIKGTFHIYDVDGNKCGYREGVRIQCLSFLHKDPNVLLAADTLNRIKSYKIDCHTEPNISIDSEEEDLLEERYAIMSFIVDRNDKYIAVNVKNQGVNLWDLRRRTLLRIFLGVTQRNITIFSSFSSPDSTFLASGSEDGRIYIYHVSKDQPVAILNGHKRCVNCVSWNPTFPELLVSVSDDRTVRLWSPIDPNHPLQSCPFGSAQFD